MFKSLHPNIKMRLYTSFLSRIVGSTIFPFMAIYFTAEMNSSLAGVLLMSVVIIQFISGLYGGYLADSIGRKKIMIFGELLKTFSFLVMLFANSPWWFSPWTTFFTLLMISVAAGLVNPAAEAMLIDVSTKETRIFMYSINYWIVNLSLMIGVAVGGWFFQSHMFELLCVLLIISLLTLSITVFFITETYNLNKKGVMTKKNYGMKSVLNSYKTVIKDWSFVLFTLGGIAIFTIEFQRVNYIAVRLADEFPMHQLTLWGIETLAIDGVKMLSILTIENTVLVILLAATISKFIKNRSEKLFLYTGFLLFGLGYSLLVVTNNFYLLLFSIVVLTIGELLFVPIRQAILADMINDSHRGSYMAFNGFVYQFGKMFGALGIIIGPVIGNVGMAIHYILFVGIGILFCHIAMKKVYYSRKIFD